MGSPVAEFFVFTTLILLPGFVWWFYFRVLCVFFLSRFIFIFFSLTSFLRSLHEHDSSSKATGLSIRTLFLCGHLYHAKFASLLLVYNSISLFFSSSKRETLLLLAFSFSSYFMIIYITRMFFSSTSRFTFHVLLRPSTTGSFIASFLLDVLTFTSSFFY